MVPLEALVESEQRGSNFAAPRARPGPRCPALLLDAIRKKCFGAFSSTDSRHESRTAPASRFASRCRFEIPADHHADQLVGTGLRDRARPDRRAVAKHGGPVADAKNFVHAMGDVDDRRRLSASSPRSSRNSRSTASSNRELVGSSINKMRALEASARAIATICISPARSDPSIVRGLAASPTISRNGCAKRSRSPNFTGLPMAIFSAMLKCGKRSSS